MKTKFLLTAMIIFSLNVFSQSPNWSWGYSGGGAGNDMGYAIATDHLGNSYVTGRFNATASFGSHILISIGGPDIFVAKYNSNGTCLWARNAGTTDTDVYGDEGKGIALDESGNCYVTGTFRGQATFGSIILNGNTFRQIFVAKYDSNGNILWAREPLGSTVNNYSKAISADASGNSYITGYLGGGSNTFGNYTLNGAGAFVVKYDNAGNVIYATKIGATGAIDAYSIDADLNGNVYFTGFLQGTEAINSQLYSSNGMRDVFLVKLNSIGNFIWLVHSGGVNPNATAYGYGVSTGAQNDIYLTGGFEYNVLFGQDTLQTNNSIGREMFIAKYDSSGSVIWARQSSDPPMGGQEGFAIAVNQQSQAYVTGVHYGILNFGSCSVPVQGTHTFIVKYDAVGNCLFAVTSTGQNPGAFGYGISLDGGNNAYITGFDKAPVTFGNFTTIFYGGEDMFIAKLDNDMVSGSGTENLLADGINISPNPATSELIVNSSELGAEIKIEIYNVLGEKVFSVHPVPLSSRRGDERGEVINVSFLTPGIYFLKVRGEKEERIAKFVKQ